MENRGSGKGTLRETAAVLLCCCKARPLDPEPLELLFEAVLALEGEDPEGARSLNREVRRRSAAGVRGAESFSVLDRFHLVHKRALLFDAGRDFDAYLQYLEFEREPEHRFYLPRRRVLRSVVRAMEELCDGSLELLAVSMPPGTGKTTLAIFFLSWVMGRFPDEPSLASAHSAMLTRSIYDGVLAVLTDRAQYLWGDVFPGIRKIETSAKETSIHLGAGARFKTLTARSIGSSLTGVTRCERILYADDLVEGIETALSPARMEKLWNLYASNLRSRKKEGCGELHVATRWSLRDPIGRLEEQYGGNGRTRFISVPALDGAGRSNFDYGYGVGFSAAYFLDMKGMMDDASYRALFQGQPVEREGRLYAQGELRRYRELPGEAPDAVVAVCDTAQGGGDDTFLPVGYLYGEDCYITDCVCDDGLPEVTDGLCAGILLRHDVQLCRFESNAAGGRTADKVGELVADGGGRTAISKRFTSANKRTRILVYSPYVKDRFLFREKGLYTRDSPYGGMMDKLCGYSPTGNNRHDDVPDGMAQLAEFLLSLTQGAVAMSVMRQYKMAGGNAF